MVFSLSQLWPLGWEDWTPTLCFYVKKKFLFSSRAESHIGHQLWAVLHQQHRRELCETGMQSGATGLSSQSCKRYSCEGKGILAVGDLRNTAKSPSTTNLTQQEGGCLCSGEEQQRTEGKRGLYRVYWGWSFLEWPGIGGILWPELGFVLFCFYSIGQTLTTCVRRGWIQLLWSRVVCGWILVVGGPLSGVWPLVVYFRFTEALPSPVKTVLVMLNSVPHAQQSMPEFLWGTK